MNTGQQSDGAKSLVKTKSYNTTNQAITSRIANGIKKTANICIHNNRCGRTERIGVRKKQESFALNTTGDAAFFLRS